VGLAGGLIAGLIIGAIEKSKEGEILPGPALDNPAEEKIKMLVTNKVALGELTQAGTPHVAATTPAQPTPTSAATQVAATPPAANTAAETAAMPASAAPISAPATATAALPASTPIVAQQPTQSLAQNVATQMGCGVVKAEGNSAYVAPCSGYGVYIGCDGGECRPLHTIKQEGDQ
jgi:hypothetical protein